jgi:hypothetical protein
MCVVYNIKRTVNALVKYIVGGGSSCDSLATETQAQLGQVAVVTG